ncbi:MAG TPA: PASTA domain-containing protein, partial [Candidatus Angelobacter sp.]|nr:PASTA domain-containing protein [Candidatus Angelobacter sp.]
GSDHLGAPIMPEEEASTSPAITKTQQPATSVPQPLALVTEASAKTPAPPDAGSSVADSATATNVAPSSGNGTVVLNIDSGIVVPSFMGKSLRAAVETAQQSGLEINVMGSGMARQQSPPPGSHLLTGQKVTVRFSH